MMRYKNGVISALIISLAILPFLHDLIPRELSFTFSGYTSLRVFVYIVLTNIFALIAFIGWFIEAKGKQYRFALLVPIIMNTYQLLIYVLNMKKSTFNDFDFKIYISIILSLVITINYFYLKFKNSDQ
ncbi:MAG: hypothetical protein V3V33_05700 [Candidatus Lokiarchaeia archaeon]